MKSQRTRLREDYADLFEQVDRWGSFILANLLWCVFAVPIVTLPAATAALFAVMSLRTRGKQPIVLQVFFDAMRRLWLKATLIALLDVVVGGLLMLNLAIFPLMDMSQPVAFLSRSVTLFAAIGLVMVNLYLWSLLVIVEMSFKALVANAFKLAFAYPVWSFGILVVAALPVGISLLLPRGIFLFVTASAFVLIITTGTWRILRRLLPEEERRQLEADQA